MSQTTSSALTAEHFNRLRGRLCGLVESWGLDEKRERGMISTIKSLTYDAQKEIVESMGSNDEL